MQSSNFKIALIGRTNVGKSTLFNRISKTRSALTFDRPGVTRDAKEIEVEIWGRLATLIDAPGMFDYAECDNKPELMAAISKKLDEIIKSSDLILFVLDGVAGITEYDREIARILRKTGKRIIVVVNKGEKKEATVAYAEATEFGFDDTVQISAEHGFGISELFELIYSIIPSYYDIPNEEDDDEQTVDDLPIKLAIIGRPNVGKSTIVNNILGEEKQLVADFAGLTRESSESDFEFKGRKIKIIDTPGVRRRARIYDVLEKISTSNTRKAYRNADVVILIIDATSLECGEIEKQDLNLAADAISEGKALVIAFNKYDKTPYKKDEVPEFLKRNFKNSLSQLKEVPFLFTSALDGSNIDKMLSIAVSAYDKQTIKVKTHELNEWLSEINQSNLLQSGSARFKLKYIVQVGGIPPTFMVFVANKENMRVDHERFIINNLKQHFGFQDVPVNVYFKAQKKKQWK